MKNIMWIIAITASLAIGCGKKDEGADQPTPEETAGETPAPDPTPDVKPPEPPTEKPGGDPSAAAGDKDEVPTAEDFEEQAIADIKPENLEQELKKVEEELGE